MKRAMRKTLSFALALVMAVGCLVAAPVTAGAVDIGLPGGLVVDVAGTNISTGNQVYFGSYTGGSQSGAMKWRIVENDGDYITLFCDGDVGERSYDPTAHNGWSGSEICGWLNGTFFGDAFRGAEQGAINPYGATEVANTYDTWGNNQIYINQKIVLPSYAELQTNLSGGNLGPGTWNMGQSDRAYSVPGYSYTGNWWLRSPGESTNTAAFVLDSGLVVALSGGNFGVGLTLAIRPAFKINLDSVLFTSAATGGKSGAVSADLSAAQPPTGAVKLTLLDTTNLSPTSATPSSTMVQAGETITIDYAGATAGANNYVSCVLEDSAGITHYGALAQNSASGTASLTIPAGLAAGSYTLRVFNEQINGAKLTDYASTPTVINLTVTAPTSSGTTDDGYSPTFTSRTLTDKPTGVTVSGDNIDPFARLVVTADWLHAAEDCPACAEIRKQMAAGNVLALYDISLTGYHTGAYDLFIPFTGNTGQSYTTLHCLNGTLEQRTASYQNGGTTTTWAKLSPFAVVKGTPVTVPENVVVDPPKTGSWDGYGMVGVVMIVLALAGMGAAKRRRSHE